MCPVAKVEIAAGRLLGHELISRQGVKRYVVDIDDADLRAARWVPASDVQEAIQRLEQGNLDSALRCLRLLAAPEDSRDQTQEGDQA